MIQNIEVLWLINLPENTCFTPELFHMEVETIILCCENLKYLYKWQRCLAFQIQRCNILFF